MVCVYLFGKLMIARPGRSIYGDKAPLSLHSSVCRDNLVQLLAKIELIFRPVTVTNSLVEDLSKMIEVPIDEVISAFTSFNPVGEPDVVRESVQNSLESIRSIYNKVLADIPETALHDDEDFERRDKDMMQKL